jgi:cell division protein FtsL
MLVALIVAVVIALALAVLWFQARGQITALRSELDQRSQELTAANADLASTKETLSSSRSRVEQQEKRLNDLDTRVAKLTTERDETADALRKRTELADAQAMQIDVLSAERDAVQEQLAESEKRIEALAARPGALVGAVDEDEDSATLWDLEVARTERLWRASVAINPTDPVTPFAESDDPVRTAVEIEAAALREDVGALIAVDWQAAPIDEPARRLVVLRVAQELLAQASRAPGASRLLVREDPTADQPEADGATAKADAAAQDDDSEAGQAADAEIDLTDGAGDDDGAANTKAVGSLVLTFEPLDDGDGVVSISAPQVGEALRDRADEPGAAAVSATE